MAKKVLLITGASGNVGKASLAALSPLSGLLDVKAGVRNPAKPESAALADIASNITVVKADPLDSDFASSLTGVDYLYIVTPGSSNRTEVAVAAINAAKAAGIKFVLLISVFTVPLTDTTFGKQFSEIEKVLKESGLSYTSLQLPFFHENNFGQLVPIKQQGSIYGAVDSDKPFTSVAVKDIADVAAKILSDPEAHFGKTYRLTAPLYTNVQLAKAFSEALEKPVSYVQVPFEAVKESLLQAGFQEWQADGINELNKLINEQNSVYVDSEAVDTIQKLLGRSATSIEDWVKAVAPAFK